MTQKIEGAKLLCEIPPGTLLINFRGAVIACGPDLRPHFVTEGGLVPIDPPDQRGVLVQQDRIYASEAVRTALNEGWS